MPKFYQPLDLIKFPFADYRKEKQYSSPVSNLGEEFTNFLATKELIVDHILVIWRPPGGVLLVHSDGQDYNPNWARLNYIHGGPGTVSWWLPNDEGYVPETSGIYPAKPWPMDKIYKAEEADLQGFNIMNVGTPHGVNNVQNDRWAVSLNLIYNNTEYTSFAQLSNIFSDYAR
jgi:hypothetical protein